MNLRISHSQAISLLQAQITEGKGLLSAGPLTEDEHEHWEIVTASHLKKIFGKNSDEDEAVFRHKLVRVISLNLNNSDLERMRSEELRRQVSSLSAIVKLLSTYAELGSTSIIDTDDDDRSRRVFVVHGRNETPKHEVARFLERIGLESVVLDEQINQGRTIIEKFEDYSDVGYAVAILAGDDRGGLKGDETLHLRARQNVIFELGYFLGKLGRRNVSALHEEGVEIPTDYQAVVYIPLDAAGGWKLKLIRELQNAGLSIDLSKAY